jgi:hypothetical protein
MPEMVYIREIHRDSFLLLITNGEGFRLRDYSAPGNGPAVIVRQQSPGWTASRIRELASQPGNHLIRVPERAVGDYEHRHEETQRFNKRYLSAPVTETGSQRSERRSWVREIIVGVVVAVLAAAIVAWLGLNK